RHRALLRLIIAERDRFPDLARMYYERAPVRTRKRLSGYLRELEQRNVPAKDTAEGAAEFFIGMVAHEWIAEVLLLGAHQQPTSDAIRERAARVVDRLLRAFHAE